MKATGIVRNIDELGRIVIPKELRNRMDMPEGSAVEIYVENDKITLSRYYVGCHFCNSQNDLYELKGKKVCKACLGDLADMANQA